LNPGLVGESHLS